ncbi:Uncharacterised protein [uncultured Clostridium sp.]|nr:Uncharacterised protein [uncultured Clostridium sp.]SCI89429.1 Uncharacterised protein [uncultured Clostridium sp.]
MQEILNTIDNILEYNKFRNDNYETAEFIEDVMLNYKTVHNLLFITLDLFEDNEDNINFEYIFNNLKNILTSIESYRDYQLIKFYEDGEVYERDIYIDTNKYYPPKDDILQDDWIQLESIEGELELDEYGFGYLQSKKKKREDISMYY